MKKKFLAVLLACTLAAGIAVSPVGIETVREEIGDEGVTENGLKYWEVDNGIKIAGYTGDETEIIIPDTIDGKTVTSIGEYAFRDCSSVTSITIPEGITSIDWYAFEDCSNLTSVTLPESLTEVGSDAFANTPWLEELMKQGGELAIADHIVIEADKTISGDIAIPEGVTSIGCYTFSSF